MIFLALFRESVLFALHALRVNRLRTILSLLGVTIGIFAIITVFTAVDSMEKKVRESMSSLGENVVYVEKWPWTFGPEYPWWKYINRPLPDIKELEEVKRRTTLADAVVFVADMRKTVSAGTSFVENCIVTAASHDFDQVNTFDIKTGRYFSELESETGRAVAVIGSAVADALFPSTDPVGQTIKLFGRNVEVVGVVAQQGESMFGTSLDAKVLLPMHYARTLVDITAEEYQPHLLVKARNGVKTEDLTDELEGVMRGLRRLKPTSDDNFALNEVSLLAQPTQEVFNLLGTIGWIIGAFSILVGGFGIANIMFVSVRERTSQIGIQKSLGARNSFILMQFMIESVVLCLIGGILGLLLVWVISVLVASLLDFDFSLSLANVVLGISISILIGLISGFIPSYSASQLDPVEAIRSNA
ncbi:MAG: ABC transporter permease [Bacteroidetes bacterium]|nr:ABC transporter permease [Bacteroidota bacterium]